MLATAHPMAVAVFGAERAVETATAETVALASVMATVWPNMLRRVTTAKGLRHPGVCPASV